MSPRAPLAAGYRLIPLLTVAWIAAGCSVWKAAQQPEAKNVGVLNQGITRAEVVAELGAPVSSEVRDGNRHDIFAFKQGYSKATKAGRVFVHAAADVATLGLWEVVGMPLEATFDGRDVKVEVIYDDRDFVREVHVIEGQDMIRPKARYAGKEKPDKVATKGMRWF